MNKNKIIFYLIWIFLLSLAPVTILSNSPLSYLLLSKNTMVGGIQRLFGLWVFTLMFFQIVLGSFMAKWTEKLGGWVFRFHIFEGILIYSLILIHTFSFVVIQYFSGKGFDPFYVYMDVCLLCGKIPEWYYNFGRLAFWFITIAVFAGLFRTLSPFLRVHWKKFHILNYIAFLLVGVHSLFVGSDIGTLPFSIIHAPSLVIVVGILVFKGWSLYQTSRGNAS